MQSDSVESRGPKALIAVLTLKVDSLTSLPTASSVHFPRAFQDVSPEAEPLKTDGSEGSTDGEVREPSTRPLDLRSCLVSPPASDICAPLPLPPRRRLTAKSGWMRMTRLARLFQRAAATPAATVI